MPKIPMHLSLSACLQGRRLLLINLLMCTFELYMFIGVSMQLRELSEVSSDPSVALEKKNVIPKICCLPSFAMRFPFSGTSRRDASLSQVEYGRMICACMWSATTLL